MIQSTWDEAISTVGSLPEDAYVCFMDLPNNGQEQVAITQEADWQDGDDRVPAVAATAGFTDCLAISDLGQIIANAEQQVDTVQLPDLRRAVAYYWDKDAFLVFNH